MKQELEKGIQTELNLLRLPLYKCSKKAVSKEEKLIFIDDAGNTIKIENGHKIGAFHRKLIIGIEFLYKRQHPNYDFSEIVTTYSEIARLLNIHSNSVTDIWNGILALRNVVITTKIKKKITQTNEKTNKTETKIIETEEVFNLFPRVKQIKSYNEKGEKKRTNSISIELNNWHIDNFKNNYFRLINANIALNLKSSLAIRLFDYFVYKGYFKNKNGSYSQKRKLTVIYDDLIQFTRATPQKGIKDVRKQFAIAVKELTQKEILEDFEVYRGGHHKILLTFYLKKKFQWKQNMVSHVEALTEEERKKESIKKALEFGLSENQLRGIIDNTDIPSNRIQEKVNQLEYMIKINPKITTNKGKFLYNSIISDWFFEEFMRHKERIIKAKKSTKIKEKEIEIKKLEEQYEAYIGKECETYWNSLNSEKQEEILNQLETTIDSPFLTNTSIMNEILLEGKKIEYLTTLLKLKSFKEFIENDVIRCQKELEF